MSAASLEAALRALGVECAVEAREGLAVLVPTGDVAPLADARVRDAAVALLKEHGFTHLALEIEGDAEERAALPGH